MADRDFSAKALAWREQVVIPTYEAGAPDPNPFFLEKRVYQGSSGAVYPFPVVESVSNEPTERAYDAVFIENEYLKVMVLPELGGRIQMALDKTNDYHFVYYNRVIKPALVGLAGPWVSGGIEFNWPQHHRPSTFHTVDYDFEEGADGSWTVWCHEIDRMVGTRGAHGLRLYPGKAYIEILGRVSNRTPLPETFLWWANPAVHVDANHQSIFPPDVTAVMDHGKRDTSSFPIATGTYYKIDYAPGADISRYANIPVPTSYMAHHSDYNFVGSYDHGRQAGLLHVASHHVSPGKKQWTWGCGEFGAAWDRQLTDEDGPYIELMCGVYTDNQPDFTWLSPGEEKAFTQFFMPYKGVGVIKNATTDAAVGLEVEGDRATMRVYVTSPQQGAKVALIARSQTLLEETFDADPSVWRDFTASLPEGTDPSRLTVTVFDAAGRKLVGYRPTNVDNTPPEPAKPIGKPSEITSNEALYLTGMHLEQYRHATRRPEDYFREALRRDPEDQRCNLALGRTHFRRAEYAAAEECFHAAIRRATKHNPNPLDGECHYNLGLALAAQCRWDEAEDAFWKSTWRTECQDAAYFELGRIAAGKRDWPEAESVLRRCLERNANHHQATHLLCFVLKSADRREAMLELAGVELARDPFNFGVLFEKALATGDWEAFDLRVGLSSHNHLELANDYLSAGALQRTTAVLQRLLQRTDNQPDSSLVHYYLADIAATDGDAEAAMYHGMTGATAPRGSFFPNRRSDLHVLQNHVERLPNDAQAWCDLGNVLYGKRRYDEAIRAWEEARDLSPEFAQPRRNLGLAYFNKRHDAAGAWRMLEEAYRLNTDDARVLYELDQLAKRLNHTPESRLARLQSHGEAVAKRDDLTIELATLLNLLGRHDEALSVILGRKFHPWEGGEGKVTTQYVLALTELAIQAINDSDAEKAIDLLQRALERPDSLGEGKLAGAQENNVHYWLGVASRDLGRENEAVRWFNLAACGLAEPTSAQFYNDQPPEMIYYQGLALRALGRENEATSRFEKLVAYGEEHLDDEPTIDFFAVSLPDFLVFDADLAAKNELHCRFMMALGWAGLNDDRSAGEAQDRILRLDRSHLGAMAHIKGAPVKTATANPHPSVAS
ncbi:DUF5107 domain-containing protein [Botrimarina mediterranea]|uniref:tetratricopeptide repeat protein n=1 Tax=Botrimarina mediterranea TaxID=2528022 RepID=UPI0011882745|nr:tetratricopeptide repeat protein [Planctomycetes bacterium K2D]